MSLSDLLGRGYFPKELPNPFVTTSFASAITASDVMLPEAFKVNLHKNSPALLKMAEQSGHLRYPND